MAIQLKTVFEGEEELTAQYTEVSDSNIHERFYRLGQDFIINRIQRGLNTDVEYQKKQRRAFMQLAVDLLKEEETPAQA